MQFFLEIRQPDTLNELAYFYNHQPFIEKENCVKQMYGLENNYETLTVYSSGDRVTQEVLDRFHWFITFAISCSNHVVTIRDRLHA